jgi:putative nucleotidyltransferase with HDIG domain
MMSLAIEPLRAQQRAAILLVGAPPSLSGAVHAGLAGLPARVELAGTFGEACERLRRGPYSLVVCSQPAPTETRAAFLDHLADSHPGVPCLFSTHPADIIRLGCLMEPAPMEGLEGEGSLLSTPVLRRTLRALVAAMDARDPHNVTHSYRVTLLALRLGQALELTAGELETLELAALLHDVGKLVVPEQILAKPGALDEAEWEVIKQHPVHSARIVMQVSSLSEVAAIVRHHHERVDGRGYPDRLAGEEIPALSRLISIVDAYEAMTARRAYRAAMETDRARGIVRDALGSQFDRAMGEVFLDLEDLP